MLPSRRQFIQLTGVAGVAGATGLRTLQASAPRIDPDDAYGVLVDIPNCIGCRKCEFACQNEAGFDPPAIETFDDMSVFAESRRPHPRSYTVVNEFEPAEAPPDTKTYVKVNCLHCNDPACVSACLVSALQKKEGGAVVYDPSRCMGCRYCMVACPFQIPTYEYDNALTPQVRKCDFCFERVSKEGGVPACIQMCPREVMNFGKRRDLLALAHEKIEARPDFYIHHVYGEHEAGGTAWMYLSSVPFESLGFPTLDSKAPSQLTERIQHGVFKWLLPPIAAFTLLGAIMSITRNRAGKNAEVSVGVAAEESTHA